MMIIVERGSASLSVCFSVHPGLSVSSSTQVCLFLVVCGFVLTVSGHGLGGHTDLHLTLLRVEHSSIVEFNLLVGLRDLFAYRIRVWGICI